MNKKIVIIGAGLSGLLTAYRLLNKGFDIEIIEARNRIGGRIHTLQSGETNVDMGATWFNEIHKNLSALLDEFQIEFFEQFMKGSSFFEPFSATPAQVIEIPENSPSYRIVDGTSQLVEQIKNRLKIVKISLSEIVTEIDFTNDNAIVVTNKQTINADFVISTIPQSLLVFKVKFKPNLPQELRNIAKNTHTWMQDSIKVALVYKKPFWRAKGISGTVFSNVGPITELYDHSNYNSNGFALCGFANGEMVRYSKTERQTKILLQLEKIFGKEALDYSDYYETIWSVEEYTKNVSQEGFVFPHQNNGHPIFRENYYNNRLFLSGTETASEFPGYMEGAIIAANHVASVIVNY